MHTPTKHNQSLRGSSSNDRSTKSPINIFCKPNTPFILHMEKQEAIHPEEVLYQSSAKPLAAPNKHEETRSTADSKKGFIYISNIVKYIGSIIKPIKTDDIQLHATDTSKKDEFKFTNILLSPEDPSNIIGSPETNSLHIHSKSNKSKKTHHVQPTTKDHAILSLNNKVYPSTIATTETNAHAEPQHTNSVNMNSNHYPINNKSTRHAQRWQNPKSMISHLPPVPTKAPANRKSYSPINHHRFHSYSDNTSRRLVSLWPMLGSPVAAVEKYTWFGWSVSVSMSKDGTIVATWTYKGGNVRIFKYSIVDNAWNQLGGTLFRARTIWKMFVYIW